MLAKKLQGALSAVQAGSGEAIFTNTASSISWTVPTGVTSISAVCIGGGGGGAATTSGGMGGGGGDLRYYNNLSVTPGETLTITVGASGARGATGTAGGFSRIARSGTTLLEAAGGGGGTTSGSGSKNGTSSTIGGSIGGGDGGTCGNGNLDAAGGGGGAGGYAGNGGNGGFQDNVAGINAATNSGAGGGGGGGGASDTGGAGGGVNVFGIGRDGVGGLGQTSNGDSASGGSYGGGALNTGGASGTGASSHLVVPYFGGGAGGADNTSEGGNGGQGVVRIVWSGATRSFPSTSVGMSEVITTVIETQSSTSGSITIPASALAGDLAVLLNSHDAVGTQSDPSGWTRVVNSSAGASTQTIWYRILQSGDAGATVTMTGGANPSSEMILFRKGTGTVSSVSVSGATIQTTSGTPTTQTQSASTATSPFIVVAGFNRDNSDIFTADMNYYGGVAGSGNIEPSSVFNENGDTSRRGFLRFRIYDAAPLSDVNITALRTLGQTTMSSFIIEVT